MESNSEYRDLWIYAIAQVNAETNAKTPVGLGGSHIDWNQVGGLLVATSSIAGPVQDNYLEQYQQIMLALLEGCECLPVRFGTRMRFDALRGSLQVNEGILLSQLQWISGFREIAVRWLIEEADSTADPAQCIDRNVNVPTRGGGAYLRSKQRHANRANQWKARAEQEGLEIRNRFPDEIRSFKCNAREFELDLVSPQSASIAEPTNSLNKHPWLIELTLLVAKEHCDRVLDYVSNHVICETRPLYANGPWPAFSFIEYRSAA